MTSKNTFLLTLALLPSLLWAQTDEASYRLADATQTFRLTQNAAALDVDSVVNRGYAQVRFDRSVGDYTRVQEGDEHNALRFETERYQRIGRYLVGYGRFDFDYGRVQNRSWCDVRRAYDTNPYFSGSSVAGKYDNMDFSLTAALGTVSFSGFRFGAHVDYGVGDLSRLRDPRSRSEMLDYCLTPSVSYTVGRHTIGLNGHYRRRKEKMPTLTTVQTDPNLMYYQFTGMENAIGTVGGYSSFSREWVRHQLGAELDYGFRFGDRFSTTNALSINRAEEDVLGQYKYEPGCFFDYTYGLQSYNRVRTEHHLHNIDLSVEARQAYADEYREQLNIEKDPETGYNTYSYERLLTFSKRYQVQTLDASLRYRLQWVKGTGVHAYAGVVANYSIASNKHVLPTSSFHRDRTTITAEGGCALIPQHLWMDFSAGYSHSMRADLTLADPTTDYAQNVLIPDMDYYNADYWHERLQLTYQFPITIKKTRSMWYVRGYVQYLSTLKSPTRDFSSFGFTLGIFN